MKKISQSKAKTFSGKSLTIQTYDFQRSEFEFSTAKISGRFPESGYIQNTKIDEIYFVTGGSGSLVLGSGETLSLSAGDAALIEKNDIYFCEGSLDLVVVTVPAFSREQQKKLK